MSEGKIRTLDPRAGDSLRSLIKYAGNLLAWQSIPRRTEEPMKRRDPW